MFSNQQEAKGYLSAMIDGEGSVACSPRGKKGFQRVIKIVNTEISLIETSAKALDLFHVTYTILKIRRPENRKDLYIITIHGRDNFDILANTLSLSHPGKRYRLHSMLSTYSRCYFLDPVELERMYLKEGLSKKNMASRLGVSIYSVSHALRKHNLKKPNHRRPDPKKLYEMYVQENLSQEEIASRLDMSQPSVSYNLRKNNIKKIR